MFIGHFGFGLGAKYAAPRISLGTLFLASQFIDLLWPTLLLLGFEQVRIDPGNTAMTPLAFTHYPISHSLVMVCAWGALIGLTYFVQKRSRRGALVLFACVVSHWVLDLLVHAPDLPLTPGETTRVGLELWNQPAVAVTIESLIFLGGFILYTRATKARDARGRWGLALLVGLLGIVYVMNLMGPPPPDTMTIAIVGHAQWLFVLLAYWLDRHRMSAKHAHHPHGHPTHRAPKGRRKLAGV